MPADQARRPETGRAGAPVRQMSARESGAVSADALEAWMVGWLAEQIGVNSAEVDPTEPFAEMGFSSRDAVVLIGDLQKLVGRVLSPALLWEYPTIRALSRHLWHDAVLGEPVPEPAAAEPAVLRSPSADEPIAVVGIGCRFPGADSPTAFWKLLIEGVDAVGDASVRRDAPGWPGPGTFG